MSSHPPSGHPAAAATPSPVQSPSSSPGSIHEPLRADPFADDIEMTHETTGERIFGFLKWLVIVGGAGAALYFGGDTLKGYWVSELEEKLAVKELEVEGLRQQSQGSSGVFSFVVAIKEVTSSPKGKAYLVTDSAFQPWFVVSDQVFKKGDKVLLTVKPEEKNHPPTVALTPIAPLSSVTSHDPHPLPHGSEVPKKSESDSHPVKEKAIDHSHSPPPAPAHH